MSKGALKDALQDALPWRCCLRRQSDERKWIKPGAVLLLNFVRTASRSFEQISNFLPIPRFSPEVSCLTKPNTAEVKTCRLRIEVLTMKQLSEQCHAKLTLRCFQLARRWSNPEERNLRHLTGLALFPNNTLHREVHDCLQACRWLCTLTSPGILLHDSRHERRICTLIISNNGILRQLP